MAELKPEAEKLVQATREALRPTEADRERVFAALLPQLGAAGLGDGGASGAAQASSTAKATLLKISTGVVGLGVAGGGLFLALRSEPLPAETAVPAPAKPVPTSAPIEPAPEKVAPVAPEPEPTQQRTPAASRSADNLAKEVAILSRASAELRAGRPAAALKALEEHQREFPGGMLAQERTAARIQALCALGRTKEARSELARLSRSSPNSPHEARARKACGFGAPEE